MNININCLNANSQNIVIVPNRYYAEIQIMFNLEGSYLECYHDPFTKITLTIEI